MMMRAENLYKILFKWNTRGHLRRSQRISTLKLQSLLQYYLATKHHDGLAGTALYY